MNTFEIEYRQNFFKIRKLIIFVENAHAWGLGLKHFQNQYQI